MTEKILACPYCGGEVVNSEWNIGSVGWLECDNCGATSPRENNIADAILLWNAAANALAARDAEIKRLNSECGHRLSEYHSLKKAFEQMVEEKHNNYIAWQTELQRVAAGDKRQDELEAEIEKLRAERDELKAALADTEEQRHETVSKLSLALIREAADNKRQDELEAEIEKLRESMEFFSENASNYLAERDEARRNMDEARRVARVWYKVAFDWMDNTRILLDALNESIRKSE